MSHAKELQASIKAEHQGGYHSSDPSPVLFQSPHHNIQTYQTSSRIELNVFQQGACKAGRSICLGKREVVG